VDDQVILKSDGFPTYHLANVVDDHLMEITTVIRGEEWINSVPKHLLLYEYLGWDPPVMVHLPLLRNNDKNKSKLSKRKNPTSIMFYRDSGYLPEALTNFLGLMGWAMPGGEEKFTLEEMAAQFRLEDISLGGPVFDVEKLRWLNGRYIREDYDAEGLFGLLETWALNPRNLQRVVPLIQPRLATLADWGPLTGAFFTGQVEYEPEVLVMKGKTGDEVAAILQMSLWRLEGLVEFTPQDLESLFNELAEVFEVKLRDFALPFYVALSGSPVWTPLFDSMVILGPNIVRNRIRHAVEILGGGSGKKLKKIEKEYAVLFGGRK
jgi:glutamyl-tRNA synthetase